MKVCKCTGGRTRATNVFWEPKIEVVIIPCAWCNLPAFIYQLTIFPRRSQDITWNYCMCIHGAYQVAVW